MFLFGKPDIPKFEEERDFDRLAACLDHRDPFVRFEAAQALAGLKDGRGWRFLYDSVRQSRDSQFQAIAAAILGELGDPRAVPVLQEALSSAQGEALEAIHQALQALGEEPAADTMESPQPGNLGQALEGQSIFSTLFGGAEGSRSIQDISNAVTPRTDVEFLTAEQHLENAVQLRESELQERGLVECSLALWLSPGWANAWYLRGVLFEDLERDREAQLAYTCAVELDGSHADARDALAELDDRLDSLPILKDLLVSNLTGRDWQQVRDAAVVLGNLASQPGGRDDPQVVEALIPLLADPEREVRGAAVEALGKLSDRKCVGPLLALNEASWLMRFLILQALSDLGSAEAVAERLRDEMTVMQERNPVFSSQKDPLLELEYNQIFEIGVLALERSGDLEGLLAEVEGNAWEDEEVSREDVEQGMETGDEEDREVEDDNLLSYVDETSLMEALALERLSRQNMGSHSIETLHRLVGVPDLTLLDLEGESGMPVTIHDFTDLRREVQAEITRRS